MPSFRGLLHPGSNPCLLSPALVRGFFTTGTTFEAPLNSLGTQIRSLTGYRLFNRWDKSGGHVPLIRGARSFLHRVVCRGTPTFVSCKRLLK